MKRSMREKIDAMKTGVRREFYAIGLRGDLAELIARGLQKMNLSQRELADITEWAPSYVSRLMHADTDFKIGVVARALVPLGIIPRIVDSAEYERLLAIQEEVESKRLLESSVAIEDSIVEETVITYGTGTSAAEAARLELVGPNPGSPARRYHFHDRFDNEGFVGRPHESDGEQTGCVGSNVLGVLSVTT